MNNRLEAYVQRVKEIDETKQHIEHELNTVSSRYQKEMESLRERLSREVESLKRFLHSLKVLKLLIFIKYNY